jgi:tetratricopeptide (TPR) repeat protein
MNRLHTSLLSILLLAAVEFCTTVHADELKDISQLAGQGQHAQALERVNAYIKSHPGDVAGLFLKGVILSEQNKSAEAIRIFTAITEAHPELPEPYNNLAVLYADQGQYDKARLALEKAIKTHPSYATAHENLGDIYAKMASDAYDKALQLDRSNARAQTKLSLVKELFSSGKIGSPSPTRTEESANVKVASATPPALTPVPVPVPAETARPMESKAASSSVPVVKEKDKSVEKPMLREESSADPQKAVLEAVEGWAHAWSSRNVDGYLAYYADDFKTPNGESRSEWEATRRERISKPASIRVEVLRPKVSVDGKHATISFKQSYRAGGNGMRTGKTLHLQKSGEKWLITQELANH